MTDKKTTQTFTMFPDFIKSDKRVTNLAKMIYSDIYTIAAQGKEFFASNAWLAERYCATEVTISRAIKNLNDCGYIKMQMNVGSDKKVIKRVITLSDEYKELIKNDVIKNDNLSKMISASYQKRQEHLIKNDKGNISPNISTNKHAQSKISLESDFEKLWKLYPRKKDKARAFKSYKKAIKDGVTNKEIQTGIVNLKKEISLKGTDIKYVPYGSTWFNGKQWEDDYETGNVEQINDYKTNEIARLENELQDDKLDPIERNFMSKKLAELKGSA